ncbi:HD-GYP domain-containing protein (c-di-GMP phosphodiesterase class II), partial [Deinococcus sp. UYEF24]
EVERQAGRHFDPEVVRVFLSLMVGEIRF